MKNRHHFLKFLVEWKPESQILRPWVKQYLEVKLGDIKVRGGKLSTLLSKGLNCLALFLTYTATSYCLGSTIIPILGYPARVSGKSMQPTFNPAPLPEDLWSCRTDQPMEDPFHCCQWRDYQSDYYSRPKKSEDWVWVSTWRARNKMFTPGQVVVYVSPKDPYDCIIKRVLAVAGDIMSSDRGDWGPHMRIPEGHIWLEGDNWGNSVDSNKYGPISAGLVFGVATRIIWPPARMGKVDTELSPSLHPERVITTTRYKDCAKGRSSGVRGESSFISESSETL